MRDLAPADHVVVRSSEAWRDYGVTAGPYFVLADGRRDVVLGEGAATEWGDVLALTSRAVAAGTGRSSRDLYALALTERADVTTDLARAAQARNPTT